MSQKNPNESNNNDTEIIDLDYQIEQTKEDATESKKESKSVEKNSTELNFSESDSKNKILEELQQLYKQLEEKDDQYNKMYNRYLRTLADYENLEKRTKAERSKIIKNANKSLLLKLLDLADTFDKAETTMASEETINLDLVTDGFQAIKKQFGLILKNEGIERIKAIGEKFDPNFHEAVFVKPEPNVEENTVLEEVQTGYFLYSSLLRPTKVVIAKREPKGEK